MAVILKVKVVNDFLNYGVCTTMIKLILKGVKRLVHRSKGTGTHINFLEGKEALKMSSDLGFAQNPLPSRYI